jgi:hypothetical protein
MCVGAIVVAGLLSPSVGRAQITLVLIDGGGSSGFLTIGPTTECWASGGLQFTSVGGITMNAQLRSAGHYNVYFDPAYSGGMGITNDTGESFTTPLFSGTGLVTEFSGFPYLLAGEGMTGVKELFEGSGSPIPTGATVTGEFECYTAQSGTHSYATTPNESLPSIPPVGSITSEPWIITTLAWRAAFVVAAGATSVLLRRNTQPHNPRIAHESPPDDNPACAAAR